MERIALKALKNWLTVNPLTYRKPLVIRGARQVGKSYLVRDFCQKEKLTCFELNFEKEPSLRKLFVEGDNAKTIALLEAHLGRSLKDGLLFLDEIQSAPEVFTRLRYFYEDSPQIPVIAAGSLLEFALAELETSVPVGRIEFLHLGPMRFEEFLMALNENAAVQFIQNWKFNDPGSSIPTFFHEKLLTLVRDFSIVGGMPQAIARYIINQDFLGAQSVHHSILDTYRSDFGKYRNRIPHERLERVFTAIPAQVGKKWVHARVGVHDKAKALEIALDALSKAKVAHRVFHSSGNGNPLAAEQKDNIFKVLFLDVGLLGALLGLRITDFLDLNSIVRVNEGAIAEQWIGQHLLDLRPLSQMPQLFYWVREKAGSMAEIDYLISMGIKIIPIEVKEGATTKAKSLQVFMNEKKAPLGIHFSINPPNYQKEKKILELPFYMVEQLERVLLDTFT